MQGTKPPRSSAPDVPRFIMRPRPPQRRLMSCWTQELTLTRSMAGGVRLYTMLRVQASFCHGMRFGRVGRTLTACER